MDRFIVTPSPHITHKDSVKKIMFEVITALMPVIAVSIYYFKGQAAGVLLVSITAGVVTEYLFRKIRKRPVSIRDGSAIITGILLALTLPPNIPLWMAGVGAVVAIGLGKQVYGGLGSNIFNPALVGRAFLLISFPAAMKIGAGIDAATSATVSSAQVEKQAVDYFSLLLGNTGGTIGEVSTIVIILAGLYLLYKRYINWRIPVSYLGTIAVFTLLKGENPLQYVLTGGVVLGAFFLANDTVTTPITRTGRWIFGIIAGILTVIIPGYIDAVMYSILLANAVTPIINRYAHGRIRGRVRVNG